MFEIDCTMCLVNVNKYDSDSDSDSGQQIRIGLRSWSATFTHNFDAHFGAILRT